jgi:hypothetical protein
MVVLLDGCERRSSCELYLLGRIEQHRFLIPKGDTVNRLHVSLPDVHDLKYCYYNMPAVDYL